MDELAAHSFEPGELEALIEQAEEKVKQLEALDETAADWAKALGRKRTEEALDALIGAMFLTSDELPLNDPGRQAVIVLQRFKHPGVTGRMLGLLTALENVGHVRRVLSVLTHQKATAALPRLRALTEDEGLALVIRQLIEVAIGLIEAGQPGRLF